VGQGEVRKCRHKVCTWSLFANGPTPLIKYRGAISGTICIFKSGWLDDHLEGESLVISGCGYLVRVAESTLVYPFKHFNPASQNTVHQKKQHRLKCGE